MLYNHLYLLICKKRVIEGGRGAGVLRIKQKSGRGSHSIRQRSLRACRIVRTQAGVPTNSLHLAGVGEVYGKKLTAQGFDKAYVVLGQFLLLKKDEELFVEWLKEVAGMTSHHAQSTFNCLNEWSEQHM